MKQSESITALAKALVAVQAAIVPARRDATNPFIGSRYADLGSIWEAVRGPLGANGFAVLQPMRHVEDGVCVETVLMHESGEWISGETFVPAAGSGNLAQAYGSATTYARRYGLAALLGVVQEDDDGHSAAPQSSQPQRQAHQTGGAENGHAKRSSADPVMGELLELKRWLEQAGTYGEFCDAYSNEYGGKPYFKDMPQDRRSWCLETMKGLVAI